MQLTSAAQPRTARRSSGGGALARLNHPFAAALVAYAGWAAFVLARWTTWAHGRVSLFIMSGMHTLSHPAQMFPRIAHVPSLGYDGQFYYRFALDPFNWSPTAFGITVDHNYRYTRIGYSLVAWLVSLGGHGRLLPAALVLINLVCVGAMAWLGAMFARDAGRHALWGLLFAGYFGLVISVGRDTAEPLADACMLGGLLAYRRGRYALAALLLAYGVFTNEPVLVAPAAIAVVRLVSLARLRTRPGRADLAWLAPAAVYLGLQAISHAVVAGPAGGVADASANLTLPFTDLLRGLHRDMLHMSWTHLGLYDYNLIEAAVLAVFLVAGLLVLRATTAPAHERVAFAGFVLVEVVCASKEFWFSVFGDGRTYVDSFLLAVVLLIATPASRLDDTGPAAARHAHVSLAGRVFAANRILPGWRLGFLATLALAALIVVARRRVLFQ